MLICVQGSSSSCHTLLVLFYTVSTLLDLFVHPKVLM